MVMATVYLSGGTLTNVKSPASLVITSESFVPRVSLVSVTVAPGMTAPCESLTVPEIVPVVICADADAAIAQNATTAAAANVSLRTISPPADAPRTRRTGWPERRLAGSLKLPEDNSGMHREQGDM